VSAVLLPSPFSIFFDILALCHFASYNEHVSLDALAGSGELLRHRIRRSVQPSSNWLQRTQCPPKRMTSILNFIKSFETEHSLSPLSSHGKSSDYSASHAKPNARGCGGKACPSAYKTNRPKIF
jgi:hypothetical protein